jgi:hypothetical protein
MAKTKAVSYTGTQVIFGIMTEIQHTSLMKKIKLLVTILTVTSLVIILTSFSSALNITLNAPNEVTIGEEFDMTLGADAQEGDIYQVKVFINRSIDNKAMSEILVDGEWKIQNHGASYYFNYPSDKVFSVRATTYYPDATTLCAYMKKGNSISKSCIEIELEEPEEETAEIEEQELQDQENEIDANDESTQEDDSEDNEIEEENEIIKLSNPTSKQSAFVDSTEEEINEEPIILNSNAKKSSELYTKEAKTRIVMNYVLAGISILALFLIATKRI